MNYLDIILAIPLIWGLYKGVSKGIVKELAALIALIAGIYGAVHFADNIHPYLKEQFAIESSFLPIVSFAITFIAVKLIGFFIDKIVKAVALGIISRLLGGIFGVLKTAFILSALLLIINTFDYYLKLIPIEQKKQSVLYKPISNMIPSIMPNVKDGDSLIKEADKIWKDAEEKINLEL